MVTQFESFFSERGPWSFLRRLFVTYRVWGLQPIGVFAYRVIARIVGRLIFKCGGVQSVFLRGGSVRNCRPGVSDLDFLIVLEPLDTLTRVKTLVRIRKVYRLLRMVLGIPAEVIVDIADNGARHWMSRWPLQRPVGMGDLLPLAGEKNYSRPLGDENVSLQGRALQAHQQYYHALLNFHASLRQVGRRDFYLRRCRKYLNKAREIAEGRALAEDASRKFSIAELVKTAQQLNQIAASCFSIPVQETPITLLFPDHQDCNKRDSDEDESPMDELKRGSLPWEHVFTVDDTQHLTQFFESPREWDLPVTPICVLPLSGMLLASGLHWGLPNSHLTPSTNKRFEALRLVDHLRFHSYSAICERALHLAVLARGEIIWKNPQEVRSIFLQLSELVFLLSQRSWSLPELVQISDDIYLRLLRMKGVESEMALIAQCGEELLDRLHREPVFRRDTVSAALISL